MLGMSNTLHTNDSPLHLLQLDSLAKSVSFIQRKTQGFSALGFIIALIKCCQQGDASFRSISVQLGFLERKIISKVAVYKRITESSSNFLRCVISELIKQSSTSTSSFSSKHGFSRILVEDSTFQAMGKGNALNFPAHGNGKSYTAGFKVDLAFDLLTGSTVSQSFTHGTHQDKELGKALLELIQAKDLIVRDMGYFSIGSFQTIESKGAFWLTRLPANVSVVFRDGTLLEKRLKPSANSFIDEEVYVGVERMPARLVAVRADEQTASKRRRDRKRKSKNKPSNQSLVRDGWHILLTNLSTNVSVEEIFEIYSLRWSIEVRFKAWKQSLSLDKVFKRISNEAHYECLIYAALIQQLIGFNIAARLMRSQNKALSMEKLFEILSVYFNSLSKSNLQSPMSLQIRQITLEEKVSQLSIAQKLKILS